MISSFEIRLALLSLICWRRLHFLRSWERCWLMKVRAQACCYIDANNCAILMILVKPLQVQDHRHIKLRRTMHCSTQTKILHGRSCNYFPSGFSCSIRMVREKLILVVSRSLHTRTRILWTSLVDGRTLSTARRNETILKPSGVSWVTLRFASTPILYQPS